MNSKIILGIVVTFMILSLAISAVALAKKPAGKPYEATFYYTIEGGVFLVDEPVSNQAGTEFYDKDDVPKAKFEHGYWRSGYIGQYNFVFSLPGCDPKLLTGVVDLGDVYHYRHYDSGILEEDYWGIYLSWEKDSDGDGIIEIVYLLAETNRGPEPEGDFVEDGWTVGSDDSWNLKVKAQQCEEVKGRGRTKWVCTTTGTYVNSDIYIKLTVDRQ